MISKTERNSIKEIIGHRYVGVIQEELKDTGEFNKQGGNYSSGHITNVMNGEAHKIIENAIWSAVENQKILNEKRKKLLVK